MSIYVDNFLPVSNAITILNLLKKLLGKKYEMKYLEEAKTIICWQIIRDLVVDTTKINQSPFGKDLVIKIGLTDGNFNVILL